MENPESLIPQPEEAGENPPEEKIKRFERGDQYPEDPKQEGLRPEGGEYLQEYWEEGEEEPPLAEYRYAGGDQDEIIEINGIKYRKLPIMMTPSHLRDSRKRNRPYTEKEYYSHFTDGVGAGPGWDFHQHYIREAGWWNIIKEVHRTEGLSDLSLWGLVRIKE